MSLIVDQERSLGRENRMQGFGFEATTVARKEETTADHIYRADNHRGPSRINAPLAIVGQTRLAMC